MPLPPSPHPRRRLHTRRIVYEGWLRDDGLIDIEARLVDAKDHDFKLQSGLRPAGEPVHDMWVRLTMSRDFEVRELFACTDAMPYPGACGTIAPRYADLVGCNLMHGFRKELYDQRGGVRGCSHITELLAFLPTAALQTMAGLVAVENHSPSAAASQRPGTGPGAQEPSSKPFQLDRCHALEHTTETVRRYYPKWYRGAVDAGTAR